MTRNRNFQEGWDLHFRPEVGRRRSTYLLSGSISSAPTSVSHKSPRLGDGVLSLGSCRIRRVNGQLSPKSLKRSSFLFRSKRGKKGKGDVMTKSFGNAF